MNNKALTGTRNEIPLVDLKAQYQRLKSQIDPAIQEVIDRTAFIGGQEIKKFEKNFGKYLGEGEVVSCANGTDALEMILTALGIGRGDEVIVPAMSWISTSEVVVTAGAEPIFVDIDPQTYCIDPEAVENAVTKKTKAIIAVHLYGASADLHKLQEIANENNLHLIEDSAQAHGTDFKGEKVGNSCIASAFSFYPGKNLGCYGDGGAVYTRDRELAEKIRMIAHHGQKKKHRHILHGRNSRLDTLQAAILNVKLPHLDDWIEQKRKWAGLYHQKLHGNEAITLPTITEGHSFHLFVIQVKHRQELRNYLKEQDIQTGIHYPKALPFHECYNYKGHRENEFPVAAALQKRTLSLPMYAELTEEKVQTVIRHIKNFLHQ